MTPIYESPGIKSDVTEYYKFKTYSQEMESTMIFF